MNHIHHIIPRHAGGSDDPSNLVELTVEEHAEAHRKLFEQHGRWQDRRAWELLSGRKPTPLIGEQHPFYGKKRPEHSKRMKELGIVPPNPKGTVRSVETRKLMSENNAMRNPEHRKKVSEGLRGRIYSDATREKLRRAAYRQHHGEDWENKLNIAADVVYKQSLEHRLKISQARKAWWAMRKAGYLYA
jgi:HNH endonuclease/NUMOD3 motif